MVSISDRARVKFSMVCSPRSFTTQNVDRRKRG